MQPALLAAACAVALAGCGGDDDDSPAPPPGPVIQSAPKTAPSALRERLDRLVTRLLTDRGLDPAVAECAVAELGRTVSEVELEDAIAEIRKTGAAPPEVIEAAAAAGEACGRQ